MPFFSFVCKQCNETFEKYVPLSDKKQTRDFCSRSCQMSHLQSLKDKSLTKNMIVEGVCVDCGKQYKRKMLRTLKEFSCYCGECSFKRRFCTTYDKLLNKWTIEFGKEIAQQKLEEFKNNKSESVKHKNNGMFNKHHSEEAKQSISQKCSTYENKLKGKTFVEFYGEHKAKQLSEHHSKKLREGYASGKLSLNNIPGNPVYKDIKLRSNLELDAIKFLENRDNLIFGQTLLYEIERFQYFDEHNKQRTYIPDLFDVVNNIIYEVKPFYKSNNESFILKQKRLAVESQNRKFKYITEKDLK